MKNITLLVLLSIIISSFSLTAQTDTSTPKFSPKFYIVTGIGAGTGYSANYGINYIIKDKYSIMIGKSFITKGYITALGYKSQDSNVFELTMGRMIKLTNNNKIRLNLKGGLGFANTRTKTSILTTNKSLFGFEYKTTIEKNKSIGIVINPEFEFAFSKYVGLSLAPTIKLIGPTYIGISLNLMIGNIR